MKSNVLVLDPAQTYDLITVTDVLQELQLTTPSDNDKTLIQKQITGISAAISKYCDRVFPIEKVEETLWENRNTFGGLRGSGSGFGFGSSYFYNRPSGFFHHHRVNELYLKRYPIESIDSVYVDDVAITSDSNDASLRIDRDNGILYKLENGYMSSWHFGKSVVATYTGGFTKIPEDLQRAAIRWVEMAWFASGQDSLVRQEQVYGIASVSYDTTSGMKANTAEDVPDEIKLLLESYTRKWSFA
jgi:hypothetical protein